MEVEYQELLKRAYSKLPPITRESKRFEIPRVRSSIFGAKTVIHNFKEICETIGRDPSHLLKFLTREMATAGNYDGARAVFQGRFPNESLNALIKRYVTEFVICPICKRPDTRIIKEKRLFFLICDACGARSSLRAV